MCEGALGRAASRNGKKRVNPTSFTACGFCLSLLFLLPIIGVFLSFPVMTHIPAWLPITPFHTYPSLCCLPHLFGNHLLRVSTALFLPFTRPLLSVPSFMATLSLLPLCPAFSLMSTSFLPDTAPRIPLFHVVPCLPPALRSQRRWQPRCRMREGAPRPGSRSRPRSPAAL